MRTLVLENKNAVIRPKNTMRCQRKLSEQEPQSIQWVIYSNPVKIA